MKIFLVTKEHPLYTFLKQILFFHKTYRSKNRFNIDYGILNMRRICAMIKKNLVQKRGMQDASKDFLRLIVSLSLTLYSTSKSPIQGWAKHDHLSIYFSLSLSPLSFILSLSK